MVKQRHVLLVVGACLILFSIRMYMNFFDLHIMLEEFEENVFEGSQWMKMIQESMDLDPVTKIRSWGCDLNRAPLVYVHIGKCGGGSALSRLKPDRSREYEGGTPKFCHRTHPEYLSNISDVYKTHQGTLKCDAVTPLGLAIGCREPKNHCKLSGLQRPSSCKKCDYKLRQVYVGHNFMGSELHWINSDYLSSWWKMDVEPKLHNSPSSIEIRNRFRDLDNQTQPFCVIDDEKRPRPNEIGTYDEHYSTCLRPIQSSMDEISLSLYESIERKTNPLARSENRLGNLDWSSLYGSLPVLRVTVVREPFSWVVTKYFWHMMSEIPEDLKKPKEPKKKSKKRNKLKLKKEKYEKESEQETEKEKERKREKERFTKELGDKCLDLELATFDSKRRDFYNSLEPGWLHRFSMQYLFYLCGQDCAARYTSGISSINDLAKQAEGNLRHSFAVVGLLEDMDTFYDMITDRFMYINSYNKKHDDERMHSISSEEKDTCRKRFQDPIYQRELLEKSEALSAIVRLYEVAKEVNSYQLAELSQCKSNTTE